MNQLTITAATAGDIVPSSTPKLRKRQPDAARHRFKIIPFTNRAGSQSWRVTGTKRDGTRMRDNFSDLQAAQNRQVELEAEFQARQQPDSALRATRLTDTQVRLAEVAFVQLDSDEEILAAVDHWLKHGRQHSVVATVKLDEASEQFVAWLDAQHPNGMRDATRKNLRKRVRLFANSVSNLDLSSITSDVVFGFLDKRDVSGRTKINDRLALSRFFAWCKEKPRRWLAANPAAKDGKTKRDEGPPPEILSVEECQRLLRAAEEFKQGRLGPYLAVCLFGGLRPTEAARLNWQQVNLADGELRLESTQTKTRRSRVVTISNTLAAWLKAYKGLDFYPSNFIKDFRAMRLAAGFGNPSPERPNLKPWAEDVMRHTAISHYFRLTGSYGLTAEWAGNSEQIVKAHYQGRVSSTDTRAFYALLPTKKGGTQ